MNYSEVPAAGARVKNSLASSASRPAIDEFRGRHLAVARRQIGIGGQRSEVTFDDSESPLGWLARRRGPDGKSLIAPQQLQAGERLRSDFTCANLMPSTTSKWSLPGAGRRGVADAAGAATDTMIAARQRVRRALEAAGPEFAGLLVDVCCFLKGLEDVERERRWPKRTAKIVLQLGLDRLARHYGYAEQVRGPARGKVRTWLAEDAEFCVDGG